MSVKDDVCDLYALRKAIKDCQKGVRHKPSVIQYSHNGLLHAIELRRDLLADKYKPSPGRTFKIYEPKERVVTATLFKDRVPQRVFMDLYLREKLSKIFIPENCACQRGKGTDKARMILKTHLQNYYKEYGLNGYVLKVDCSKFFASIDHDVVKSLMRRVVDDDWAYQFICDIVDSQISDVGLGLGSEVNQNMALLMLHPIDIAITRRLNLKYYVRYMDDTYVISNSKEKLIEARNTIIKLCDRLKLKLNQKKTCIQRISEPIHCLGFSFLLHPGGRVTMKVLHKSISRRRRKLKAQARLVLKGIISVDRFTEIYNSSRDHFKKGSRSQLSKLDKFFNNIMEDTGMRELIELRKQYEELLAKHKALEAEVARLIVFVNMPTEEVQANAKD